MNRLIAVTALFCALLNGVALVLGQFAPVVLPLSIFLVVYLILAVLLVQQKRIAVWVTFFVGQIGWAVALMMRGDGSPAPEGVFYALVMINFIASVCAFIILWHSRRQ